MDERLRICLWMVSGGGLGAVLGALFGALTGALYAQSGGAAGTSLGRRVADAFARAGQRETSPIRRGAIIGAADGFVFLGVAGTLAGVLVATVGGAHPRWLGVAAVASVLLVGMAAFFGVLAYAMTYNGVWAAIKIVIGGLLGSFVAAAVLGADRCLLGTIPGLLVGLVWSFFRSGYAPSYRPPRLGKPASRQRSDSGTDITDRPPHRPDDDAFRQADASEEP